jgi:hypothetical protein
VMSYRSFMENAGFREVKHNENVMISYLSIQGISNAWRC